MKSNGRGKRGREKRDGRGIGTREWAKREAGKIVAAVPAVIAQYSRRNENIGGKVVVSEFDFFQKRFWRLKPVVADMLKEEGYRYSFIRTISDRQDALTLVVNV